MKVTEEDAELLSKLTSSIQHYANDKMKLLEGISTLEDINY